MENSYPELDGIVMSQTDDDGLTAQFTANRAYVNMYSEDTSLLDQETLRILAEELQAQLMKP